MVAGPAAVVAIAWVRLEAPHDRPLRVVGVVALALAPALAPPLGARIAALVVSGALAARLAFGVWPNHPLHFVEAIGSRLDTGVLAFYDVRVPFDPRVQAEMRGVVLGAIFGFVLVLALAAALGKPVAAAVVLLVAAGWPATLAGNAHALPLGVAILVSVLVLLAGTTSRRVPRTVVPATAALALVALAASTSAAVTKGELVSWQRWDFYNAPQPPVSVSYVWDAQYGGISFPARRTTVLEIKAPARSAYWRAALLDTFADDRWVEGARPRGDVFEPASARERRTWVRQAVRVDALADTHLVAAGAPARFEAGDAPLVRPAPGLASLPSGLTRGFAYTALSYEPRPSAAELERSPARYPRALVAPHGFLDVWPGVTVPPFGAAARARRVSAVLDAHPEVLRYRPIRQAAADVAGRARTPYDAAVALERWFRVGGGFTYTNHPAVYEAAPLVGFVAQTKAGYCQYFAGAMALMLRYLGIPARVAVGFSSGTYDSARGTWTVTDHDAHAWVEAWFRGYGWLPFDPTPATGRPERGTLDAPYAVGSSHAGRGGATATADAAPAQAHRHGEAAAPSRTAAAPSAAVRGHGSGWGSLVLALALLAAAALAGVVVVKQALRRTRHLTRDPRRQAAACRRELADFLLDQRIGAARSATLHELGALVREELAVDPDAFVRAATAARFGPPAGAARAARDARRELRLLVRRMRPRLTVLERARGLVSLRSLGLAA